ncbi:hypothetical protein [Pseudomonas sp. TE3610]
MATIGLVIAVLGLCVKLIDLLFKYLALPEERRHELGSIAIAWQGKMSKLGNKLFRIWMYLSLAVLIAKACSEIIQAIRDNPPVTQASVFLMIMNVVGVIVFAFTAALMFRHWRQMDSQSKKRLPKISV